MNSHRHHGDNAASPYSQPIDGTFGSTHARHVLHEDGQRALRRVSETAVVLNNPLVTKILQQLDFTF